MTIGFIVWGASLLVGAGVLVATVKTPTLWQWRKLLGEAIVGTFLIGGIFVVVSGLSPVVVMALEAIQIWMLLLASRLSFGRLDEAFLQKSTVINVIVGLALVCLTYLSIHFFSMFSPEFTLIALAGVSILVATLFLCQILWTFRRFNLPNPTFSMRQLPTVSVCIPARNEDRDLAECIAAVLRSDYPKLEVIVLDDCSQDRTADVIKSFAHDGVRFVQGEVPATGWLGKNQAMQTMAEHASGQWLLFISVDTLLGRSSVTKLVHYALAEKKQMVSVLPQNHDAAGLNTVLGTLQYFWQVALPVTLRRVPVSGKCWLIKAEALTSIGGFDSVKHKIMPEGSFARRLFSQDSYRFFVSDARFDASTAKTRAEQMRTSVRLLYPVFKRQPFLVLLGVASLAVLLLLPFCMLVIALFVGSVGLFAANFIAVALLIIGYMLVLLRTHPGSWVVGFWFLPATVLQEVLLLMTSMLSYEFSDVNWKGRNVCYPVISRGLRSMPLRTESKH